MCVQLVFDLSEKILHGPCFMDIHELILSHTHAQTRVYPCTNTHTYTHTLAHKHTHSTHTHTNTYTDSHTHTRARAETYSYADRRTGMLPWITVQQILLIRHHRDRRIGYVCTTRFFRREFRPSSKLRNRPKKTGTYAYGGHVLLSRFA